MGEYWEYGNGLIFKNGAPYSLQIPEGRAIFESLGVWRQEFEYRDVWNNLRVTFGEEGGQLVKKQHSDYDVYGYEFNKGAVSATNYFKYQNQERIEDYGLNIDFFKYRPSDPTIGRFWSGVDPLAEQFYYNSTYALQENKFGLGVELEGAELKIFTDLKVNVETRSRNLSKDYKADIKSINNQQLANTFVAEVLLESTKPGEILSGVREKMAEYSGGNEQVMKQQEMLTNVTDALRNATDILSSRDQKINLQNPDLKIDNFDRAKLHAAGILMAKNLSMEGEKQTKTIAVNAIDKVYPVKEHGITSGFGGGGSDNINKIKDN